MESHLDFVKKYSFEVELLADPEGSLLSSLGVPQTEWEGTMYWSRTTFLVSPEGEIKKIYQDVNPKGHEKEILEDLKKVSL